MAAGRRGHFILPDSPDLELNSEDVSVGRTGDETNLTLENCQSPTLKQSLRLNPSELFTG